MYYFREAAGVASVVRAIWLAVMVLTASAQDVDTLLNSTSLTCTNGAGTPQFCAPWPTEEIVADFNSEMVMTMLMASSTCDPADTATMLCENGMNCNTPFCPSNVSVDNLLSQVADNSYWRSLPFNSTTEVVTIDIDLGRPYILFTVTLQFPAGTAPERLRLERANSAAALSNTSYSLVAEISNSSDGAGDNFTVEVTNATAYSALLASAAGVQRLVDTVETQHLRLSFLETGSNVTAATGGGATAYFYALSAVTLTGLCQCNGHASSCAMGVCDCEHGTTGLDCATCNSSDANATNSSAAATMSNVGASRVSGASVCLPGGPGDDDGLTTDEIIIIACCVGGGLLILIVILVVCCCVRKRNRAGAGGFKEEITVIDATGLHHVVLKNRGFKEDGYDTNTGTKLMPQDSR